MVCWVACVWLTEAYRSHAFAPARLLFYHLDIAKQLPTDDGFEKTTSKQTKKQENIDNT